jgi:hypothetical protein
MPPALVVAMATVVAPSAVAGAEAVHRTDEEIRDHPAFVFDPIFGWMRTNITEPSVVLAPDAENTCIPAYSASANVVSLRGASVLDRLSALERRAPGRIEVPQRALDVRKFFRDSTLEEKIEILRRYEVDYVMLRAESPIRKQLEGLPGFTAIDTPGEWYRFYAVDLQRLGESSRYPGDGLKARDQLRTADPHRPGLDGSRWPHPYHRASSERLSA